METHSLWKYSLTRSPDKAMVHFIPVTLGDTLNLEFGNEVLKFIYDAIIASLRSEGRDLRRGDIIQDVNQNERKYFFDGVDIIPSYKEIDNEESVPPSFEAVTEFPIHYWDGIIIENEYIWLSSYILSYLKMAPIQVGVIEPGKEEIAFVTFNYARPNQPTITYALADDTIPKIVRSREERIAEFERKIHKHEGPFDYGYEEMPQGVILFPNALLI